MKLLPVTLLLLLPQVLFAQSFSTPVKVSGTTAAHSPMLQPARNGDLYVAWYANAADIWFARTSDAGQTFTPPIRVTRQVSTNIYTSMLQRTPRFIVDTKGTIHMVWTEERVNGQNDVWYVRSTDRGDSWTQPVSIMDPDDSATYPQDFCNIACDSSDNLYVAYLDFRGVVRGTQDFAQLHLTKSMDHGASWSRPVVANKFPKGIGGTCECCKLDIAAKAMGEIDIAFRSNINNKRDIWLARSGDRGVTFDSTIRVQTGTWTINACPTTGPSIAFDRFDNLHFGWCDSRDDSNKSIGYYSLLPAGDNAIFPNRATSRPGLQAANWPSIAVSRVSGGIACAYQAGTSPRLRFTYSADGGNTWTQDMPMPDVTGGQQSLVVPVFAGNNLYVVWQEGPSAGSIYFASVSNLPPPQAPNPAQPIIQPDPSAPTDTIQVSWTPSKDALFVWYSYSIWSMGGGKLDAGITRDTTRTIYPMPEGAYQFALTTNTSVASSTVKKNFTKASAGIESQSSPEIIGAIAIDATKLLIHLNRRGQVAVYDLLGRKVFEREGSDEIVCPHGELTRGRYFLRVASSNGTEIIPVIIP